MNFPKYQYRTGEYFLCFEFISEGPQRFVKKLVEYNQTTVENIYNLGFGDYDESTGRINDLVVTNNNGDSQKVSATVAFTVYTFIEKYPDAKIFATGSTFVRTRLYRMGITNNLTEISKEFIILGYAKDKKRENFIVGED